MIAFRGTGINLPCTRRIYCSRLEFLGGAKSSNTKKIHVDDKKRAGRPSNSRTLNNVAKIKALLDSCPRLSI